MAKLVYRDPLTQHTVMEHTVTRTYFSQETPYQQVDVFETVEFGTVLALGGVVNVAERDEAGYHEMLAHVPLMAHPDPKRVLIIGGGDGGTLREVVKHPCVEEAVLVEIDEVVIDACKRYLPETAVGFAHPKARVIVGDGLAYVRDAAPGSFDVILVDSTDPVDAGVVLFTEEFYRGCHRALKADGVLVPQSDSIVYYAERVSAIAKMLRGIFERVDFYTSSVPTYPGGLWSFAFASKGPHPFAQVSAARLEALEAQCSYYNGALHRAAFALPTFMRRAVCG
jgi:spermidine synthase